MHVTELFEKITSYNGNAALVQYFNERPVEMWWDLDNHPQNNERMMEAWEHFLNTAFDDATKAKLSAYLGVPIKDIGPSDYYEMPSKVKSYFARWLEWTNETAFILHDDPLSAPAWMLMKPVTGKLLPKNTPLVHFSDHAAQIKVSGFQLGVPDVTKIALTREHNPYDLSGSPGRRISYNEPGYNFAYMADGSIDLDLRAGGYDASALLFQSSGMLVHHNGDRENQVVFWGASANTRQGIVMTRENSRWISDGGNSDMSLNRLVRRLLNPTKSAPRRVGSSTRS